MMKKIITLSMLFVASSLFAQEDTKKLSITGSVDTYYRTLLSASDDAGTQSTGSFADQTGFALGMANLVLAYEGEKTGLVADLVFGPRGDQAILNGAAQHVNQLYAYWNVSEGTTLTAGRFNTYLGYEVISPVGNFNYSTSQLFNAGPFSHLGIKADFALSEDFSLMVAVMNATDFGNNTTGDYALGTQLGYKGQFLNFYYDGGKALGFEVDYTGGFDVSNELFLGINAAYNDNSGSGFYGVALYPQYALSNDFSLGLRGEFFETYDDIDSTDNKNITGLTLTGSYTVENLMIKPEFRLDSAGNDEKPFTNNDGRTNSLAAFTIAAIYSF